MDENLNQVLALKASAKSARDDQDWDAALSDLQEAISIMRARKAGAPPVPGWLAAEAGPPRCAELPRRAWNGAPGLSARTSGMAQGFVSSSVITSSPRDSPMPSIPASAAAGSAEMARRGRRVR